MEYTDIINKEFLQNCGDTLFVIEKSNKKQGKNYLYRCQFQKYPYEIYCLKQYIISGSVLNPRIEEEEFIKKEWLQHCGDLLRILKRSEKSGYFICEFIKYPYQLEAQKSNIIRGGVENPKIEEQEFIGKTFKQTCGDFLKVLNKTIEKKDNRYLFECEFLKYSCFIKATKGDILNGKVSNPNFPWRNKEIFKQYILDNFKEKPTLQELSDFCNMSRPRIGQKIIEYNMQNYIQYFKNIQEDNLRNFIKQFIEIEEKEKYFKFQKEYGLDIYIPSLKIGFEYNGNYWHSDLVKTDINYHQEKKEIFKENNINIYYIWEFEWNDLLKQCIIKSYIKSKLGIFEKKIGARQCQVKEINYKEYTNFCNENHLQGSSFAKLRLGLFYKNELIQILSFDKPRFTDKYEWEIIRECSKLDYQILGGKEKLWKYFVEKYNPNNCISYCDFSKFDGNSYLKLGFEKERLNKPGFWWYNQKNNEVYWRNPLKHNEYKNKFNRIYDAGQLVFVWNKF